MNLTPQQELFARALATGKSQADAYREAYPSSKKWADGMLYSKASTLAAQDKVKVRVAQIREPVIAKHQMTLDSHLTELNRLKFIAVIGDQMSAAIKAEELRGRAVGFYVERKEVGQPGDFERLDDGELTRAAEEAAAVIAAASASSNVENAVHRAGDKAASKPA